jgi:transcriptional antiterminator RfaH
MKPYFPGYLFVHVDLNFTNMSDLQWIPGAGGLVCFGNEPAWVSDGVLQVIRIRVDQLNSMNIDERKALKAGDGVTIHAGPLAGYRGIFASYLSDRERVLVFLDFVRDQQLRVELPVEQISSEKLIRA